MLSYLALRLAAKEALNLSTIAGDRVYDSRQFPLDGLSDLDEGPSICLYTEEGRSHGNGSDDVYPVRCHVWLTIEVAVLIKGDFQVEAADGSMQTISATSTAVTDQAQESLTDLLAAQVRRRLVEAGTTDIDPAALVFRSAHAGITEIEDVPQRSGDKALRLAGRTLRLHCKVKPDTWPEPGSAVAGGTAAALPQPLASLASKFTLPSSLAVIAALAPNARAPSALPSGLSGIDIHVGVGRPPATPPDITAATP